MLVDEVVAASVVDRCAIDMTDQKARGKLMEALAIFWKWVAAAVPFACSADPATTSVVGATAMAGAGAAAAAAAAPPPVGAVATMRPEDAIHHRDGSERLMVRGVLATEESVWSPIWGLTGKVDATITAAPTKPTALRSWVSSSSSSSKSSGAMVYPLELKTVTGKSWVHKQNENQAQLLLYTLMFTTRYGAAFDGGALLFYLQQGGAAFVEKEDKRSDSAAGTTARPRAVTSSNTVDAKSRMGALRTLLAQRNHIARGMNDMRRSTINTNVSEDDHYGAAAAGNANLRTERDGEQDQRQWRRERRRQKAAAEAAALAALARSTPLPPTLQVLQAPLAAPPRGAVGAAAPNKKARGAIHLELESAGDDDENSVNGMAITTTTMQHMMEMQKQEDKEKKALPRPCTFCYEKAQCALYHKASTSEKEDIERANAAATSGLGEERFGALTGHLTDADVRSIDQIDRRAFVENRWISATYYC